MKDSPATVNECGSKTRRIPGTTDFPTHDLHVLCVHNGCRLEEDVLKYRKKSWTQFTCRNQYSYQFLRIHNPSSSSHLTNISGLMLTSDDYRWWPTYPYSSSIHLKHIKTYISVQTYISVNCHPPTQLLPIAFEQVHAWMVANKLNLNPSKTEFFLLPVIP